MRVTFPDVVFVSHKKVYAEEAPKMGMGVYADNDYAEGETILVIDIQEPIHGRLLPFLDSFDECEDRGITFVPGFAWCCRNTHPFWFLNHSCTQVNCGFIDWAVPQENRYLSIIAYRDIQAGEQLFLDYAHITAPYDGSPEGDPWVHPCFCEQAGCRGEISDITRLPLQEQLSLITRSVGDKHGTTFAHVLKPMTALLDELARVKPDYYDSLMTAIEKQEAFSEQLRALPMP